MTDQKKSNTDIRVKNTPIFKLKDKPNRQYQGIHLMKQFGFIPETIIIEKVRGMNNGLIVRAVMTEEAIKKEDAILKVKSKNDGKSNTNTTK